MSASPLLADIVGPAAQVRKVPKAEVRMQVAQRKSRPKAAAN
jgi:hypothetical protein